MNSYNDYSRGKGTDGIPCAIDVPTTVYSGGACMPHLPSSSPTNSCDQGCGCAPAKDCTPCCCVPVKGDKGDRGDKGEQGSRGEKGAQGIQGSQGVQGAQGLTGATGSQGPAGEKGDTGAQGSKGDQGLQGVKGDKGDTGLQGLQGIQGAKGDQGLQGVKGDKGDTGAQGLQGMPGTPGVQGAQGLTGATGPQGPAGEKGDPGAQGAKGDQGLQGVKGDTGDTGAQGTQGIQGVKGDKGDTGLQGLQGVQGAKGDTGATGAQGPAGPQGSQGVQGAKGDAGCCCCTPGPTGAQGAQGMQGADGAVGPQGPSGATICPCEITFGKAISFLLSNNFPFTATVDAPYTLDLSSTDDAPATFYNTWSVLFNDTTLVPLCKLDALTFSFTTEQERDTFLSLFSVILGQTLGCCHACGTCDVCPEVLNVDVYGNITNMPSTCNYEYYLQGDCQCADGACSVTAIPVDLCAFANTTGQKLRGILERQQDEGNGLTLIAGQREALLPTDPVKTIEATGLSSVLVSYEDSGAFQAALVCLERVVAMDVIALV